MSVIILTLCIFHRSCRRYLCVQTGMAGKIVLFPIGRL